MYILPLFLLFSTALVSTLALPQSVSVPKNVVAVHPLSSTSTVDNAYEKCLKLGIDPHGPHPDVYIPDEHGQHFEAGSKYAYWVAAQSSEHMRKLRERDDKPINVMYVPRLIGGGRSMR
jgi:hypothetical protein